MLGNPAWVITLFQSKKNNSVNYEVDNDIVCMLSDTKTCALIQMMAQHI